jgi:protocatechuate 3,4-dioxygenase beta subunit
MRNDEHDKGLANDLQVMVSGVVKRRSMLGWLALASLAPAVGCGGGAGTGAGRNGGSGGAGGEGGAGGAGGSSSSGTASCSKIPEETAGPFPGDGSNGANALALTGIVRSDITSSIGGASGVAEGVPLTVTLTLVNAAGSCAPLAGYAVYLWHCDKDGNYSMYSAASADENFLRGVQETDSEGKVTFTTIFPGCYGGRWPHIHFEVYPSLAVATNGANKVATSQLALPEDACAEAYTATGYSSSVTNLSKITLASDSVLNDGSEQQMAETAGSAASGFTSKLTVAINEGA